MKWSPKCLVNVHHLPYLKIFFLVIKTFKTYSLNNFKYLIQYYEHSHHAIHCTPTTYFITESLYLLTFTEVTHHIPTSGYHQSVLCIYKLCFFLGGCGGGWFGFLNFTYKWDNLVFASLCLTNWFISLSIMTLRSIHVFANWQDFLPFMAVQHFTVYVYTTFYLFIHLWITEEILLLNCI